MRARRLFVAPLLCALAASASSGTPPVAVPADVDTDGDGLSDYDEIHKYLTDPNNPDTDGDGIPDGDWNERRESTYSIRFLIEHLAPAEAVSDAFQDARVIHRGDGFVDLEIVVYPLATGDRDIPDAKDWRAADAPLAEWTKPNATCDFDDAMKSDLVAALAKDGVDVAKLGDRSLVERASKWALDHARYQDEGFTTAYTSEKDGKLAIAPGLEQAFREHQVHKEMSPERQFDAETRGRGMFRAGIRGSCTSSAIYLSTVLRALGVPTRTTVAIPPANANSDDQLALLRDGLRPSALRDDVLAGVEALRGSWASHTFNVPFVGGRWRRLNYEKLGEGIVSRDFQGMMLRVLDYDDRCACGVAETWGALAVGVGRSARFPDANPYRLLSVSDEMGPHAKVKLPPPRPPKSDHAKLTIVGVGWKCAEGDSSKLLDDDGERILVCRVKEWFDDQDAEQYTRFTRAADPAFDVVAEDGMKVEARCHFGYEVGPRLHAVWIGIANADFEKLPAGKPLKLVPHNGAKPQWAVETAVPPRPRTGEKPAQLAPLPIDATKDHVKLTVVNASWVNFGGAHDLVELACEEWFTDQNGDQYKRFTQACDRRFRLVADGAPEIEVSCGVGSITGPGRHSILLHVPRQALREGVAYKIVPRNESDLKWVVKDGVTISR